MVLLPILSTVPFWSAFNYGMVADGALPSSYANQGPSDTASGTTTAYVAEEHHQHDSDALAQKIFDLVNKVRVDNGLDELSWNDDLALAAKLHSQDMAEHNYFDHDTPEGLSPTDRAEQLSDQLPCDGVGENIVEGGSHYGQFSDNSIASGSIQAWLLSESHRENILTPFYKLSGVGIAFNSDGTIAYISQEFC
jgi:uncharacterized protein YkwD